MTTEKLQQVRNRENHLRTHVSNAQRGLSDLEGVRRTAEFLAGLADDYCVDTSTRAWHHEGFRLDLYFNEKPEGALDYANDFDEFNLYHGGGHAASSSDYEWHIRASVKVRYDV